VTLEVAIDPPGHARLPNNDAEIIDIALQLHRGSGRPIGQTRQPDT
jgi:hypothetical protein